MNHFHINVFINIKLAACVSMDVGPFVANLDAAAMVKVKVINGNITGVT